MTWITILLTTLVLSTLGLTLAYLSLRKETVTAFAKTEEVLVTNKESFDNVVAQVESNMKTLKDLELYAQKLHSVQKSMRDKIYAEDANSLMNSIKMSLEYSVYNRAHNIMAAVDKWSVSSKYGNPMLYAKFPTFEEFRKTKQPVTHFYTDAEVDVIYDYATLLNDPRVFKFLEKDLTQLTRT